MNQDNQTTPFGLRFASRFGARMRDKKNLGRLAAQELELIKTIEGQDAVAFGHDVAALAKKHQDNLVAVLAVPETDVVGAEKSAQLWHTPSEQKTLDLFCARSGLPVGTIPWLTETQDNLLSGARSARENPSAFFRVYHPAFVQVDETNLATLSNILPEAVATYWIGRWLETAFNLCRVTDTAKIVTGERLNQIRTRIAKFNLGTRLKIVDLLRLSHSVFGSDNANLANFFGLAIMNTGWNNETLRPFAELTFWADFQSHMIFSVDREALAGYELLRDEKLLSNWMKKNAIKAASNVVFAHNGNPVAMRSNRKATTSKDLLRTEIDNLLDMICASDVGPRAIEKANTVENKSPSTASMGQNLGQFFRPKK